MRIAYVHRRGRDKFPRRSGAGAASGGAAGKLNADAIVAAQCEAITTAVDELTRDRSAMSLERRTDPCMWTTSCVALPEPAP